MISSALPARIAAACLLSGCVLFGSCEKEVHIDLDSGAAKLVVEGSVETGLPPYVVLTRSLGFLSRIDRSTLESSFVHDAVVRISDGDRTVTLREYTVDSGFNSKFCFYSIDTADPAALQFRGEVNHTYNLTVGHGGKTYTATTTIPAGAPLDSLWIARPEQSVLHKMPGARLIYFRYTDPDTFGNYVRYYTRKNSDIFYPAAGGSVYSDEIVNGGAVVSTVSVGYNRSRMPSFDSLGVAFLGDTITVKWCAIDHGVYDFWSSYEYAAGSQGSPFSSPINLHTNISGGALGIWAGYGATFRTIVVAD